MGARRRMAYPFAYLYLSGRNAACYITDGLKITKIRSEMTGYLVL